MSSDPQSPARPSEIIALYEKMYRAEPFITDRSYVKNEMGQDSVEIMATVDKSVLVFSMVNEDYDDYLLWLTKRLEGGGVADSLILS